MPGFWSGVEEQFETLPDAARHDPVNGIGSADSLAARLVGRWRSGTPTDHAPLIDNRSAQDPARDNDFDFASDTAGDRTPACAHIRKVYPRSGAETAAIATTEEETKRRRIMRRGIPFGQPFQPTGGRGGGVDSSRGLVFQCYQSDLDGQFVFLQQRWINFGGFPDPGTGTDVVIGHESDVTVRAGGTPHTLHFAQFVHTQGALYTFTPSLPTVRALAQGLPLEVG
ncbi:hypothetical protein GCM10025868_15280 [Angustibacter aerolatus]|uniref:Dyp-type peroxidase C-terminal domain-containing protein n=1 Tax=Angustibacter aerolatus TaxID=1162965 RepID=A0ABQ6JDQ1_9ACTN|nr:Dyp-type peroxidase domain-containing protein [Angustibacter aerolatus]GMA86278.1 hypothetical protein GCM10025868_15280 [Angustibacter aerolatus]